MPATTSRGYVYPVPADPANGAASQQALATSIDTDIAACVPGPGVTTFGDYPQLMALAEYPIVIAAANYAYVALITPKATITPTKFVWWCVVQSGNYDVGIINWNTRARLWSLGSTACPAAGERVDAIAAGPTLTAGTRYGLVFAANNNILSLWGNDFATCPLGVGTLYDGTFGLGSLAASFPIPAAMGVWNSSKALPALALRA